MGHGPFFFGSLLSLLDFHVYMPIIYTTRWRVAQDSNPIFLTRLHFDDPLALELPHEHMNKNMIITYANNIINPNIDINTLH